MDDAKTTMAPPVFLVESPEPPKPHKDCDVCGALVGERAEAARAGDWSKVTDVNVEIGRHRGGRRRGCDCGLSGLGSRPYLTV
ncbi:hypothetical protein OG291_12170 [Streptomyces halstedii]|uniref:hypothetical protein n=1 Tax=Streptomyces halstedii TaxID=1944 RepID=UPI003867EA9F|nr:hypothetical protein OG291_12170 [Streptomyces halstedii]